MQPRQYAISNSLLRICWGEKAAVPTEVVHDLGGSHGLVFRKGSPDHLDVGPSGVGMRVHVFVVGSSGEVFKVLKSLVAQAQFGLQLGRCVS